METHNEDNLKREWELNFDVGSRDTKHYKKVIETICSWNQNGKINWTDDNGKVESTPLLVSEAEVASSPHFFVKLFCDEKPLAKLRMQKWDLYVIGFDIEDTSSTQETSNKECVRYAFKDHQYKIPGSQTLGFNGTYGALASDEARMQQKFGWDNIISAANTIAKFKTEDQENLKKALMIMLYTIPEAVRFKTIFSGIKSELENGVVVMSDKDKDLVKCWGNLSDDLLRIGTIEGRMVAQGESSERGRKRKAEKESIVASKLSKPEKGNAKLKAEDAKKHLGACKAP